MAVIFHSLKEAGIKRDSWSTFSFSQAARPEVGSSSLSSAGTVAIKDDDTHINTHRHTHIAYKLRQRVGTQAPTGESHGEREKV